jgi:hypothetical protein
MEGIIALILAGSIFYTPGTWAVTRLIALFDCGLAILYAYTPLHAALGRVWLAMLLITLAVWASNIVLVRRIVTEDNS